MSEPLSGFTFRGRPVPISELAALAGSTCVLCHADGVVMVGVFTPGSEQRAMVLEHTVEVFGPVGEGMQRVLVYGVCKDCLHLGSPIIAEMVEAKVFLPGDRRR